MGVSAHEVPFAAAAPQLPTGYQFNIVPIAIQPDLLREIPQSPLKRFQLFTPHCSLNSPSTRRHSLGPISR